MSLTINGSLASPPKGRSWDMMFDVQLGLQVKVQTLLNLCKKVKKLLTFSTKKLHNIRSAISPEEYRWVQSGIKKPAVSRWQAEILASNTHQGISAALTGQKLPTVEEVTKPNQEHLHTCSRPWTRADHVLVRTPHRKGRPTKLMLIKNTEWPEPYERTNTLNQGRSCFSKVVV